MRVFTVFIMSFVMTTAFAKSAKFNTDDGLFIEGYDPVSYVVSDKAEKGKKEIYHIYKGTKILFSSQENKDIFLKDPEKILPAYKGWCAYAMSESGELVGVDPKSFKVIDGKTYLFYDGLWADTLKKWNKKKNDASQVKDADKNWKTNFAK